MRSTGNNECNTSLASRSASGIADIYGQNWWSQIREETGGIENVVSFVFVYIFFCLSRWCLTNVNDRVENNRNHLECLVTILMLIALQ